MGRRPGQAAAARRGRPEEVSTVGAARTRGLLAASSSRSPSVSGRGRRTLGGGGGGGVEASPRQSGATGPGLQPPRSPQARARSPNARGSVSEAAARGPPPLRWPLPSPAAGRARGRSRPRAASIRCPSHCSWTRATGRVGEVCVDRTEVGWGLGGLLPGLAALACPARYCRRVGVLRAGSGRGQPPAGPCANPSSPAIRHRVPKNEKDYKLEKSKPRGEPPFCEGMLHPLPLSVQCCDVHGGFPRTSKLQM